MSSNWGLVKLVYNGTLFFAAGYFIGRTSALTSVIFQLQKRRITHLEEKLEVLRRLAEALDDGSCTQGRISKIHEDRIARLEDKLLNLQYARRVSQ